MLFLLLMRIVLLKRLDYIIIGYRTNWPKSPRMHHEVDSRDFFLFSNFGETYEQFWYIIFENYTESLSAVMDETVPLNKEIFIILIDISKIFNPQLFKFPLYFS